MSHGKKIRNKIIMRNFLKIKNKKNLKNTKLKKPLCFTCAVQ